MRRRGVHIDIAEWQGRHGWRLDWSRVQSRKAPVSLHLILVGDFVRKPLFP